MKIRLFAQLAGCFILPATPALTVAQTLYWDTNGSAEGSSNIQHTWDTNPATTNWSTSADGTVATQGWTAGYTAIFSAGTNATGSILVDIAPSTSVSAIQFQEGTVEVSGAFYGGSIVDLSSVDVASGITASLNATLTQSSGAINLTKTGAGTLNLIAPNSTTGSTTVSGGTMNINSIANLGSGDITVNNGATLANSGILEFNSRTINVTGSGSTLSSVGYIEFGDVGHTTLNVSSGGEVSSQSSIAFGVTGGVTGTGNISGTDSLLSSGSQLFLGYYGTGNLTIAESGRVNVGTTLDIANQAGSTGTLNLNSGGTLAVGGTNGIIAGGGTATWNWGGGNLEVSGSSLTTSLAATLGAGTISTVNTNGYNATLSGVLSGDGGLAKSGTGTLTLATANTYSGGTTVNGGTLLLGNSASLGSTSGTLTLNGGLLDLGGFSPTTGTAVFNGGSFSNGNLNNASAFEVQSGSLSASLGGTASLTKTGSGTFTLAGTNTFAGSTTITEGTLSIAADSALGTAPGSATPNHLTLDGSTLATTGTFTLSQNRGIALGASGGTFDTASDTTLSYGGVIAGTGSLTKSGSGTLAVTGANTYSGGTTVTAGTLSGNTTSLLGNITNNGIVNFDQATTATYSGNISGTGSFTKTGAGALTLSGTHSYAGTTTVSNGSLLFSTPDALYNGVTTEWNKLTVASEAGVGVNVTNLTFGASEISTLLNDANFLSGSPTLDLYLADNYTLTDAFSLDLSGTVTPASSLNLSGAGFIKLNGQTLTLGTADNQTFTVNRALTGGSNGSTFTDGAVGGFGGTLSITGGSVSFDQTVDVSGGNGGSHSFGGGLIGGTGGTISIVQGDAVFSQVVDASGGAGGRSTNFAANGAAGAVGGTLSIAGGSATFSQTVNLSGGDGGNGDSDTYDGGDGGMGGNGGSVTVTGGLMNFDTGASINLTGGEGGRGGDGSDAGNGGNGGNGGTFSITGGAVAFATGVSVDLSGGDGDLGGFGSSLGTAGIAGSSGTLSLSGGSLQLPTIGWLEDNATLNGNFSFTGGSLGATDVGESINLDGSSRLGLALANGSVTSDRTLDLAGDLSYSGVIAGTGDLTKAGTGTLTLSGANTITGDTILSQGTLVLGHVNALQNSTLTVDSSLSFGSLTSANLGGLGGSQDLALTNASSTPVAVVVGGNNADTTFSGALSGTGSLTKNGTGTLTFAGTNTYSGGTTVNAGTLSAGSAASLGSSDITVNGGTLSGSANLSIDRDVTVDSSDAALTTVGHLEFGSAGTGSLTVSNGGQVTSGTSTAFGVLGTADGTGLVTGADSRLDVTGVLYMGYLGSGELTVENGGTVTSTSTSFAAGGGTGVLNINDGGTFETGDIDTAGSSTLNMDGGTLRITGSSFATTIATTLADSTASTIDTNGNSALHAGNITGSGALIKSGSGNLTLAGTNDYSGGTTVSGGTLTGNTSSLQGDITNNAAIVFDQASAGTYADGISGTGALTKSGAGTLTLSGSNTYSGGTTVSSGTLTGTTSSLQGDITNNAAVVFDQASAGTYADVISGTGSLTKSGAGTLTLSGSNTYSGGTTVSGGTLTGTTSSLQGNITNNAAVVFDQTSTGSYAGNLSGSGSLTKTGSGTLTLTGTNSYAGGTTVSGGTLAISSDARLGDASGALAINSGATLNTGGDFRTNRAVTVDGSGSQLYNNGELIIGNNGTGSLSLTNNATTSTYNLTLGYTGGGGTVDISSGSALTVGNQTTLGTAASSINLNTGGTLTTGGLSGSGTFNLAGGTLRSGSAYASSLGANLSNASTVDTNGFATTLSGNLTGSGSLTKAGAGTLTLSGTNDYSGGTVVTAGTLTGNTSSLQGNIENNAALVFEQFSSGTYSGTLSGTGSLTKTGAGNLTLTGSNSYAGGTTVSEGTLSISSDASLGASSGALSVTSGATLATGGDFRTNRAVTIDGAGSTLSNNGELIIGNNGTGSLALTNNATATTYNLTLGYTGGGGTVDISSGSSLWVGNVTALGTASSTINLNTGGTLATAGMTGNGTFNLGGGTLRANGSFSSGQGMNLSNASVIDTNGHSTTLSGTLAGEGALTKTGDGSLILSGANTYSGGTTVSGGTLILGNGGSTGTLAGDIVNHAAVTLNRTGDNTIGNVISGSGEFTLNTGILRLSQAQTYTGATTVNYGAYLVLPTSVDQGLSADTMVTVAAGGNLDFSNRSLTIAGLSGAGTVYSYGGSNGVLQVNTAAGQNQTFSGSLGGADGNFSFIKSGEGSLTLSGLNTYTGTTTVSGGNLLLDTTTRSSAFDVATGSSLTLHVDSGTRDNGNNTAFTGTGTLTKTGAGTLTWGEAAATFALESGALIDVQAGVLTAGSNANENWSQNLADLHVASGAIFSGVEANVRVDALTGSGTIRSGYNGAGYSSFTFGVDGGSGTFSGVLADTSEGVAGHFTKTGSGTQILSGTNTYTGTTTVEGGVLAVTNDANLGSGDLVINNGGALTASGSLSFANGRTLTVTGTDSSLSNAGNLDIGSTGTAAVTVGEGGNIATEGVLSLATNAGSQGTFNLNDGGTLQLGGTNGIATGAGTAVFNANGGTIEVTGANLSTATALTLGAGTNSTLDTNGFDAALSGTLGGTGSWTKTGAGNVTLSGSNNFSGSTTVEAGTLILANDAALGTTTSGTTVASGAAVVLTNDISIGAEAISSAGTLINLSGNNAYAGTLSGTGGLSVTGGTLTLSGTNTYTGSTTVTGSSLAIAADSALGVAPESLAAGHLTLDGGTLATSATFALDSNRGLTIGTSGGTLETAADTTLTLADTPIGTGALTKQGNGTLVINGSSPYAGETTIAGGTLNFANRSAFFNGATGATLYVNPGATAAFHVGGAGYFADADVGSILGSAHFNNNATLELNTANASAGTFTLATAISDTDSGDNVLNFTKSGAGSLVLTGGNTYTGATTIEAGTLQLGADNTLSNQTTVNVATGATFDLNDHDASLRGLQGSGSVELGSAVLTLTPGAAQTFSGNLSGTGVLALTANSLTLSGNNSLAQIQLNGGNLQLGSNTALSSGTRLSFLGSNDTLDLAGYNATVDVISGAVGTIDLGEANGHLTLESDSDRELSLLINGTGTLSKSGSGNLTFSGSFGSGANVNLNAGTFTLGSATVLESANVSLNGGSLNFGSYTEVSLGALGGSGSLVLNTDGGAAVDLTVGANNSHTTFSGSLTGSGSLTKTGYGAMTIDRSLTHTGDTNLSRGTLDLGYSGNLTQSTLVLDGGYLEIDHGRSDLILGGLAGSGSLSLGSSWLIVGGNNANTTFSGNVSMSGFFYKTGSGNLTLNGQISGAQVGLYGGTVTLGNSNAFHSTEVQGDLATLRFDGITSARIGALSTTGNLELTNQSGAAVALSVGDRYGEGYSFAYDGVFSGNGSLTKIGEETFTLSGAHTYTGGTTVSAGTLVLASTASIAGDAQLNGGTLSLANSNGLQNSTVTLNGGTLAFQNVTNATIKGLSGSGSLVLNNTGGTAVDLTVATNNSHTTFSGSLTGSGSLTKTGPGSLTIENDLNHTGNTVLSQGILDLGNSADLTNSTLVLNGGSLQIDYGRSDLTLGGLAGPGSLSLGSSWLVVGGNNADTTFSGSVSTSGLFYKIGSGDLTLNGQISGGQVGLYGGTITLGDINAFHSTEVQGDLAKLRFDGITSARIGALSATGNLQLTNQSGDAVALSVGDRYGEGYSFAYDGVFSGNGSLTKIGEETFTLTGAHTYTGETTVSAGTLVLASTASITGDAQLNGGILSLANSNGLQNSTVALNGGTLAFQNLSSATFGGLSGSGNLALTNTGSSAVALTIGGNNNSTTFSGSLSGSGSLTKTGAGTLTLSGVNSHSGDTTISGGTLRVDGTLDSATLAIENGGTLAGTGVLSGTVMVASGGTIAPGNSPGTLETGSQTWAAGGIYLWELNDATGTMGADPGWDLMDISGSLTITATSENPFTIDVKSLDLANNVGSAANFDSANDYSWTIAFASSGIYGFDASKFLLDSAGFQNGLGGGSFGLQLNNNALQLTFTAVPEPRTWALLLGCLALGLVWYRRRPGHRSR